MINFASECGLVAIDIESKWKAIDIFTSCIQTHIVSNVTEQSTQSVCCDSKEVKRSTTVLRFHRLNIQQQNSSR